MIADGMPECGLIGYRLTPGIDEGGSVLKFLCPRWDESPAQRIQMVTVIGILPDDRDLLGRRDVEAGLKRE